MLYVTHISLVYFFKSMTQLTEKNIEDVKMSYQYVLFAFCWKVIKMNCVFIYKVVIYL